MAYTETALHKHVASEHAETSTEVICPVCAALPGGGPVPATNNCAAHLTLEHTTSRDLDELCGVQHVRRMFHRGWELRGSPTHRSNRHFKFFIFHFFS